MENRGWLVVVGMFVFMLVACGSGDATESGNDPGDDGVTDDVGPSDDGNTDDTAPSCSNGTCETDEGCSSCMDDCACTGEYTACRNDACIDWDTINPLLKKLPGRWTCTLSTGGTCDTADVTVDLSDPDCYNDLLTGGYNPDSNLNDPGDACVLGFGVGGIILHGSSLRLSFPNSTTGSEGQVLNNGTRVEITWTEGGAPYGDSFIYVR